MESKLEVSIHFVWDWTKLTLKTLNFLEGDSIPRILVMELHFSEIVDWCCHQKITNTFKKSQLPSIFGGANSSHGFFIEIWTNFIRATFFVKDEILALEHANYCSLHHEIENPRRSTRMNIDSPSKPNRMSTDFNWFIPKILGRLIFG